MSIHPGGRLRIARPEFLPTGAEPARWSGRAEAIEATLRLAPLLAGRVEIVRPRIVRPDITLTGRTRLQSSQALAAAAFGIGDPGKALEVTEGTIHYDDGRARQMILTGLDLRVVGAETPGGVAIAARFDAGALHVKADLALDDLRLLGTSGGSPGRISLDVAAAGPEGELPAELRDLAASGDVATLLRKLGAGIGLPSLTRIDAEGRIAMTSSAVALEDATFSVGGVSLDGRARVAVVTNEALLPRLRALQDDAERAVVEARAAMETDDWAAVPIGTDWLSQVAIDFELSGQDLSAAGVSFEQAALDLSVGEGAATLFFDGASEAFGTFRTAATLSAADAAAHLDLSSQIAGLSLEDTVEVVTRFATDPLVGTPQRPGGRLDAVARAEATGRTLGDLVDSLTGSASAHVAEGSLSGGNVIATLDSLAEGREFMTEDKGPLIPSAGRTPFDTIDMQLAFAGGAADLSRLTIAGDRYRIDMDGAIGLRSGAAEVEGNAILFSEAETEPAEQAVDLPFGVGGTLLSPVIAAGMPTVAADLARTTAGEAE
ncbi:AsmA family protein [Roseivivax halotolerans]|uniref:AsmA family protein n=1 Tax=Roseivivax halotolerans TaxID=93684 RepID=UPI001587955D|nr:AsmA-like C-terminal region-containing protein [Roseivivax halotolerans]